MQFYSQLFLIILIIQCSLAKDWWENGNFYQIYPRSFRDSDGDGIGDLKGITEKLPYLKSIGIVGAWLSPIFKSPMVDFGYDISDYRKIHPEYGTMEDFEALIKKAKEIDMKIFLDFVPNHSSDKHEWFQNSIKKIDPYTNYYVWHDGIKTNDSAKPQLPNNWKSAFRYSAWEWNEERGQYYLHQFAAGQPDLNYRNPAVVTEMKDILKFWLDKGVDGFRIDALPYMFEILPDENGNYKDEPKSNNPQCDSDDYCYLDHIYTQDQPETYDMVYQWRELIENYKKENGGQTRILLTEAYTNLTNIIKYYGNGTRNGSHVPFNFELLTKLKMDTNAQQLSDLIDSWLTKIPSGSRSNWVLGNHDNNRITARLGKERADLFNILLQTLPGIAVTYNGEEFGMNDGYIDWEHTVDPQACNANKDNYEKYSRDPARTPFQWDASKNAGFSKGSQTWLPVANDYQTNNVLIQQRAPFSHLQIFKKLLKLRQEPSFADSELGQKIVVNDTLLYKRELAGSDSYIIILNLSKNNETIDLTNKFPNFPEKSEIVVTSVQSAYTDGDVIDSKSFIAYPEVGTVVVGIK